MASQTVRHISIYLSGQPFRVFLFTFHHPFNLSRHFSCIKNFDSLNTPPLLMTQGHSFSSKTYHKVFYLGQFAGFKTHQKGHIFPQRKQYLTRFMSIDKEHSFDSKEKCSVFDESGMFIKETTFNQAKLLASSQNSRLVYLRKNPDGVACFSLKQLKEKASNTKSNSEHSPKGSKERRKDQKTSATAKEYKFKASIAYHDLNIKLAQVRSHLSKDKQVIIFIKESSSQSQVSQKGASELMKRIKDELGDLCRMNQDYSNATMTRLTLTPKETQIFVQPEN